MSEQEFRSTEPFDPAVARTGVVYCSDGRFGEHFDVFLHQLLGSGRYDLISMPGGGGCLVEPENAVIDQLVFLIEAHGLARVVLISHADCGWYHARRGETDPVEQCADLGAAASLVAERAPGVRVEAWYAAVEDGTVVFRPVETPGQRFAFDR